MKDKTIDESCVMILTIFIAMMIVAGCTPAQTDVQEPAVVHTSLTQDDPLPITLSELARHNTEDDCWVVYEGKVYDYTKTPTHPNMPKTFYSHCGDESSFEQAAKAKHPTSDSTRVANYGPLVGELE